MKTSNPNTGHPFIKSQAMIFFYIIWALMTIEFCAFRYMSGIGHYSVVTTIFLALVDSLIILSPYLWIKRTWRPTVIIPLIAVPVFLYINLLYHRNVGELVAISGFFQVGNANDLVVRSAIASIQAADLWIGLPLIASLTFFGIYIKKMRVPGFSLRYKLWWLAAVIALTWCAVLKYQMIIFDSLKRTDHWTLAEHRRILNESFPRAARTEKAALVPFAWYAIDELWLNFRPAYKLSAEERAEIELAIKESGNAALMIDSLPDNSGKNLILVVMESLNSQVLETTVNGKPIMPLLDSLRRSEGVIYFPAMQPKVGLGRSSDAAFMYLCGILPQLYNPVVEKFPDADYPSIAKNAHFRDAAKFLPSSQKVWNHVRVTKSQGFTEFFADLALNRGATENGDSIGMLTMIRELPKLKQPFFAAFFTIDGHDPYTILDGTTSDISADNSLSATEKVYLEKNRHTDEALRMLVTALKKDSLWDNSIIVIASDHNALERSLNSERFASKDIPFLILNSGVSLTSEKQVAQIDLYPTMLDLIGGNDYYWRGFGKSVLRNPGYFDPDPAVGATLPESYPSSKAWDLSELMVKGKYFKNPVPAAK